MLFCLWECEEEDTPFAADLGSIVGVLRAVDDDVVDVATVDKDVDAVADRDGFDAVAKLRILERNLALR